MAKITSSAHYDSIVVGVGSMGSAACWFLARRGQKVLGLEQFAIPHEKGSHSGQSRIIRKAYFEHPDYVPLLERAYENWQSFEVQAGPTLYYRTGIIYFGKSDNENISGIRKAAELHQIPIENWSHEQHRSTYPGFEVPGDFEVIFERDAGFITPERAIESYSREAIRNGAVIKSNTAVESWKQEGGKFRVSAQGVDYTCDKLIITAGPWTSQVIPQLKVGLQVTRQFLFWVTPPDPGPFSLQNFPCWFVEDPLMGTFYGFPVLPPGEFEGPAALKLAHHQPGEVCKPGESSEAVSSVAEKNIRHFLKTWLPGAGTDIASWKSCLYTYSPDAHFIIDHLPGYGKGVTIACGFSGHGFKFASVVGEILADLAMKGTTDLPINFVRSGRF
jgi:sarcosine oxidase